MQTDLDLTMCSSESLLDKLTKENGYYELKIDNLEELFVLIDPRDRNLERLMTDLKFEIEPGEDVIIPRFGNIGPIRPLLNDEIIFRGQASSEWGLVPSLYRDKDFIGNTANPRKLIEAEYKNLIDLQNLCDIGGIQIPADSYMQRVSQLNIIRDFTPSLKHEQDFFHDDFIEMAAFTQHFGIKTSLLDWSRNILAASYFATTGVFSNFVENKPNDKHFSIWALNRKYLNNNLIKIVEPPKSLNKHIANQQGLLSITNIANQDTPKKLPPFRSIEDLSMCRVLEKLNKDYLLLKVNIPSLFALDLYDYCNSFNFNAISLFGGMHGVKKYLDDSILYDKFQRELEENSNN